MAVSALAVVVIGVVGLRAVDLPGPRAIADGERMHIEVVAPVEPRIAPGAVMDVGDLVDGFRYVAPRRREPEPPAYAPYDDWSEPPEPAPDRRRPVEEAVLQPPPQPEPSRRHRSDGRWFGFDAPDRDYRAEREARRARREARVEEDYRSERPRERRREWYRDGRRENPPPRDYGPPPAPWN